MWTSLKRETETSQSQKESLESRGVSWSLSSAMQWELESRGYDQALDRLTTAVNILDMKPNVMVRSLEEYHKVIRNIAARSFTHKRLFRGQREDRPLLPILFRKYQRDVPLIEKLEQKTLSLLKSKVPKRTPGRPKNDWDWLSFGQHFALPTRLLDWSEDPLIALFFAVEKKGSSPTVYVYDAQKGQIVREQDKDRAPWAIEKTRIMQPSVHSDRVALQMGWHTVHRIHPRKSGGKMVIPLQNMEWHDGRVSIIGVDSSARASIKNELEKVGIDSARVYGQFESVVKEICKECMV